KYPPGQDIRSKIHPDLLAWLRQNIFAVNVDPRREKKSRPEGFDSGLGYKPWWIAQHLVDKSTYSNVSMSRGLDNYLVDRAKRMARIEAELKSGKPTAIVAGALHFSGPNSVVALLEKRGYKIEQL